MPHRFADAIVTSLLLLALVIFSARSVTAQGPGPQGLTQRANTTTLPTAHHAVARDSTVRPSEWKKGALIGIGVGAATAVIGGLLIHDSFCDSNCGFHLDLLTVTEFVGSLAVFGIIGGLIGSTIHHD